MFSKIKNIYRKYDAYLAWRVDLESSYRNQSLQEFRMIPIKHGSLDDLQDILDLDKDLPESIGDLGIFVMYISDDSARIVCVSDMSVFTREPYEVYASRRENDTEVPLGTMVRVGSLLFALLTIEQGNSIISGRLKLFDIPYGFPEISSKYSRKMNHTNETYGNIKLDRSNALIGCAIWIGIFASYLTMLFLDNLNIFCHMSLQPIYIFFIVLIGWWLLLLAIAVPIRNRVHRRICKNVS